MAVSKKPQVFGFVYQIIHLATERSYIGITVRHPEERWKEHIKAKSDSGISRAIQKYGAEAFSFDVIDQAFNINELVDKEKAYIAQFDSQKHGFNMSPGGDFPVQIPITVDGIEFGSMGEAARHYELDLKLVRSRLSKANWTLRQSLGIDPPPILHSHEIVVEGISYKSITQAAQAYDFDHRTVWQRLKSGWSVEQAFGLEPSPTSFEYDGHIYDNMPQAAEAKGLKAYHVSTRLKLGWSLAQAFGDDLPPKTVTYKGQVYEDFTTFFSAHNISYEKGRNRRRRGWTLAQCVDDALPPGAIEYDGVCYRFSYYLAEAKGIKRQAFQFRLKSGWTMAQACGDAPPPTRVVFGKRIRFKHRGERYEFPIDCFTILNNKINDLCL